jgi:hypothetical protein
LRARLLSLIVTACTFAACGGTETGNPFMAETRLHAHSSDTGRVAVLADGTEARVDQVWIGASSIGVYGADCSTLVATMPAPATGDDHAQPGAQELTYDLREEALCAIAIPLVQVATLPAGAPPELAGHSILVTGVRTSDGVPFRIRTGLIGEVFIPEVTPGTHFTIAEDQPATFLGFDVATWIGGAVDLAGATPTAGTILIEMGADGARLAAFEDNLAPGFELYDDPDGSGSATPGEAKLAKGTDVR